MWLIRERVLARSWNFAGHGENRLHRNGHGQFVAPAVVDDAAPRCNFGGALLLMLSALLKFAVGENLQIDQAGADGERPYNQHAPSR